MATVMFGWELIYKLAENDIKKKEDVLLLLIHWKLIRNGFLCLGVGDNVSQGVELIICVFVIS